MCNWNWLSCGCSLKYTVIFILFFELILDVIKCLFHFVLRGNNILSLIDVADLCCAALALLSLFRVRGTRMHCVLPYLVLETFQVLFFFYLIYLVISKQTSSSYFDTIVQTIIKEITNTFHIELNEESLSYILLGIFAALGVWKSYSLLMVFRYYEQLKGEMNEENEGVVAVPSRRDMLRRLFQRPPRMFPFSPVRYESF